MDRALVSAHGKLVALVASVLHAAGVATTDEFSSLIRVLAEVVAEQDMEEAAILRLWADTVEAMLPLSAKH
jgi:hypothetical protein